MDSFDTKRVSKVVLVIVAVAVVAAGAKLLYDDNKINGPMRAEAKMLDARRSDASELGLPINPSDIDDPERMRGLALYEEFVKFEDYLVANSDVLEVLSDESRADETAELILANPEQLANLLNASELHDVNTPIDWEGGIQAKEPYYLPYNRYVQACCAIANYHFRNGDKEGAVKFLYAAAKLTTHLPDEPTARAIVTWASCSNRIVRTAFDQVKSAPMDRAFAQSVSDVLALIEPPRDLTQLVRGDSLRFVMTARAFEDMDYKDQVDLQLQNQENKIEPPTGNGVGEALESKSLWFWIEAMKSAKNEDLNVYDAGVSIDNIGGVWLINEDSASYLARSFGITYEQLAMSIMRVVQIKNLTMTTLEILAHWHDQRTLPDLITGDKDIHMDPVTGRMVHYAKSGNEFVLQFVGNRNEADIRPPVADLRLVPGQGYGLRFSIS